MKHQTFLETYSTTYAVAQGIRTIQNAHPCSQVEPWRHPIQSKFIPFLCSFLAFKDTHLPIFLSNTTFTAEQRRIQQGCQGSLHIMVVN